MSKRDKYKKRARWYIEALRYNPDFRRECDEAVRNFLDNERPDILETLKSQPDKFGEDPYKSPEAIKEWRNSEGNVDFFLRWDLLTPWHYGSTDTPAVGIEIPPVTLQQWGSPKFEKALSQGKLLLELDLSASKKELLELVAERIDRYKPKKTRGDDKDTDFPFKVYALYQKNPNFWKVTCQLYPEVSNQNYQVDQAAKARYEEVKRAYRKAQRWIDSIKPIPYEDIE